MPHRRLPLADRAGAALADVIRGYALDPVAVRAVVDAADDAPGAEAIASAFGSCNRLLTVGSGIDYPAARELALKIEEGVHLPTGAHQLETIRHGHLAAADDRTGLVLLLTDGEARGMGSSSAERLSCVRRLPWACRPPPSSPPTSAMTCRWI